MTDHDMVGRDASGLTRSVGLSAFGESSAGGGGGGGWALNLQQGVSDIEVGQRSTYVT